MRQSSVVLLTNADMTGDFTSTGINLISIYAYSIQAHWTTGSSPIGTFKLQASDDSGDNGSGQGVSQPTIWTDVLDSSQAVSGGPGSILYDVTACGYRWIRLVYTHTSGSAIAQAMMNTKGS